MATTEQLLADPEFRALPPDLREPLLIDAIAKDAGAGEMQAPAQAQRSGRTMPSVQGPGGLSEEGTFEQETTPTPESQRLLAPQFPEGLSLRQKLLGTPQQYADYANAQRPTAAQMQTAKEGVLPSVGSVLGTGVGAALGGVPGAAIGDVLGTSAGYAGNVALGVEPLDLKSALTTIGPSALLNAYSGVVRPLSSALARSSGSGKAAIYGEKKAGVEALNANVQRYNDQQLAQESMQKTAFEAAEAAKQQGRQQVIANTEQYNIGQQAQQGAAENLVATANAQAQAEYQLAREQRAQALYQQRTKYRSDVESYQALAEQNRVEKAAHAETLRGLDAAQRAGNVEQMQQFIDRLPGIPTKDMVDKAYAEAQEEALRSGLAVVYPETKKLRATLLTEAKTIEKGQGSTPLSRQLTKLGNASSELTLPEVQALLSDFKANVTGLRHNPSQYAARESRVYGRLIDALEKDFEALAEADGTTAQFRYLIKRAEGLSLKEHTVRDVTDFVTHDWLKTNPDGSMGFNERTALDALETDKYARMRGYMQRTMVPTADGKDISLYDLTKKTLATMQSAHYQEAEHIRRLTKMGDTPVPPRPERIPLQTPLQKPVMQTVPEPQFLTKPEPYQSKKYESSAQYFTPTAVPPAGNLRPGVVAIGADVATRMGLVLGATALGYGGNYGTAGLVGVGALGAPQLAAALLMTEQGQKILLKLIHEQGPRLTPTLMGFLTAAGKAAGARLTPDTAAPAAGAP